MPGPGTLSHISLQAYLYATGDDAGTTPELRAFAAGVDALANYLASGCAVADEALRRVVPDLELAED